MPARNGLKALSDTLLIHSRAQAGLADYCKVRGVPYDRVMQENGLDGLSAPMTLGDHISLRAHARSLEVCAAYSGDETFALNWSKDMGPGRDDTVSLALRYAPDFLTALQTTAKFICIVLDLSVVRARHATGSASIAFALSPEIVCSDQMIDRTTSKTFLRLQQVSSEGVRLSKVALARSRPVSTHAHEAFFGVPVRFEAEVNCLRYEVDNARQPNPMRDDDLFAALCELNRRRLDDRRRAEDFISRVCDAIAERVADPGLTASTVAAALAISVRALQRRLQERGQTFQGLHDAVRYRMAVDFLGHTSMSVSEIAYRLGFSATGNFSRAARRWFGCPPSMWRLDQRARSVATDVRGIDSLRVEPT
ncbi:AraC family transcriptional regulator [Stappia sp. ES.058]|uniref:AraC family transcriptional regulator n=1 Tax=Stappia sp. ES.058 TaxID=1881061 RepID=UPI00087B5F54|nr:AraC family transcriptional regulator [Stappia sp. ES.058]SDU28213.1 transcriptional regulator, AraC family [Stappia sp. ES.058]